MLLRGERSHVLQSLRSHLAGRLDQLTLPLSFAVEELESVHASLASRGVLFLLLDGDWSDALRELYSLISPTRWLGTLILRPPETDDASPVLIAALAARSDGVGFLPLGDLPAREYTNVDGDPRGPWRAPSSHKGVKGGTVHTAYQFFEPPYRWNQADGEELPGGLWRVSPEGFIWGVPTVEGRYRVRVVVEDEAGDRATGVVEVDVAAPDPVDPEGENLLVVVGDDSWLFDGPVVTESELQVVPLSVTVPSGREVSIALKAAGGQPRRVVVEPPGREIEGERRTRYWAWSRDTLRGYLRRDQLVWNGPSKRMGGRRPDPRGPKTFESDESETVSAIGSTRSVIECDWGDSGRAFSEWLRRNHRDATTALVSGGQERAVIEVSSPGNDAAEYEVFECDQCGATASTGGCCTAHALNDIGLLLVPEGGEVSASWREQLPDWLGFEVARDVLGRNVVLMIDEVPLSSALEELIDGVSEPRVSSIAFTRSGFSGPQVLPKTRLGVGGIG